MGKAFTYMFKDKKIWLKWLGYALIMFLSKFFADYASTFLPKCRCCYINIPIQYWICLIIGTIISFISFGYMYSCVKSLIDGDDNFVLPDINLSDNIVRGFMYSVAFMLLFIPFSIINSIMVLFARAFNGFEQLTAYIFIFVFGIIYIYLIIGFSWIFANKPSFLCFYRFKKLFEIISHNVRKYSLSFLVIVLVFIVNVLVETLLSMIIGQLRMGMIPAMVVLSALSSLIGVYFVFVNCMLLAKSVDRSLAENI